MKDIPGQEHVRPLPPGEMADTTISSTDEEANKLLGTDEDILTDKELMYQVQKEIFCNAAANQWRH